MAGTQVILNPHAASGRAGRLWQDIEPVLRAALGELVLAITQTPQEVAQHLKTAYEEGLKQIISIGGDGTNHALINALAQIVEQQRNEAPMPYGMLPIGTGRDWARSQGIPFDFRQSIEWIANAKPKPTDIGHLRIDGATPQEVHFLNIASAGLSGEVDARVNQRTQKRPWTFLRATVESILGYQPQHMHIKIDGQTWYDNDALMVVVANGTTFGHGMKIAPNASIYDGLFDVVLIEALSRVRLLRKLGHVYRGTHLQQEGVHFVQARSVEVTSRNGLLGLDLDGEHMQGENLTFTVKPGLLQLLT